jgi:hypothetical protein
MAVRQRRHSKEELVVFSSGTTRLKLWAFRTLKNTISNILSDRFTHSFSLVTPLLAVGTNR